MKQEQPPQSSSQPRSAVNAELRSTGEPVSPISEPEHRSITIDSLADSSPFREAASDPRHSVDLHIGELVLTGLVNVDRFTIAEVIGRELVRLFIERGTPSAIALDSEVANLNAGAINITSDSDATTAGIELARAIHEGLNQ